MEHLERIEQVLSIGEDCPECGGDVSKLGEDITEELEYIPGRFVVNKIIRPRMSCRRCEAVSQAPMANGESVSAIARDIKTSRQTIMRARDAAR